MSVNSGFIPPIATPMRSGRLDHAGLESLLDDLLGHVSGVLVGGSVGEIVSMTVEERIELLRAVARRLDRNRHTLCFSVADNAIQNTYRLVEAAQEAGVDLIVVSAPNYFSLTTAMLEDYLHQVTQVTTVPVCLYDNPDATHLRLSIDDIARLSAAVPRLAAVKVTDKTLGKVAAIRAATRLAVYGGEDAVLWHQLAEGARGAMVAMPLICPELMSRFWSQFAAGDLRAAFQSYVPAAVFAHTALGAGDYVAVIKHALLERGVISTAEVRPPLIPLSAHRRTEVGRALNYLMDAERSSAIP